MRPILNRWSAGLVVVATAVVVARRLGRSRVSGTERSPVTAPVIGGDTWPPVPTNPARQG